MHPPRSTTVLTEQTFGQIFGLTAKQPWLATKYEEVLSLHNECDSEAKLSLILDLIGRFTYISGDQVELSAAQIRRVIETDWGLDPSDTAISTKNIDDQNDSSVAVHYHMQSQFAAGSKAWSTDNFILKLTEAVENPNIKNIVLIDDFSGSGFSLEKFVRWIEKRADGAKAEKNVYACFFCTMQATWDRDYPASLKKLFSVRTLSKGIADFYKETAPQMTALMKEIESSIPDFPDGYSLGYEASETLYISQGFNMPNNNFPIFWLKSTKNGVARKPLFHRLTKPKKDRRGSR